MSRSKNKGTKWETAIVDYLRDVWHFRTARRVTLTGRADQGDIHLGELGDPLVVIEAKNEQRMSVAEYVDEADREAAAAPGQPLPVAWVHRRGKASPADGYVMMSGHTFARIIATLGDGFGSALAPGQPEANQ